MADIVPSPPSSRSVEPAAPLLSIAIAAAACALVVWCLTTNRAWLQDDCFITLRYAAHLAAGHGLAWNVGETPVEGFTSPLHTVLIALLLRLHVPSITAARLPAFVSHAALVVFAWRELRRTHGSVAASLAAALIAASWPLLLWDLGGLDAVPFAAIVCVGVLITLRYLETGSRRSLLQGAAVLGIACLTRPDGAVLAAAAWTCCLLSGKKPFSLRIKDVALAAALCVAVALPWQVFRLTYFHAWVPNTWYAKVYGVPLGWRIGSGLHYLRGFVFKAPYLLPLAVLLTVAAIVRRRFTADDPGLLICTAAYLVYLVVCGGDHMPGFRFFTPLVPLLSIAVVRGLARLGLLRRAGPAWVCAALFLSACALQPQVQMLNLRDGDETALLGAQVGRYIEANWPAGATVGVNAAGALPFFADRMRFIDMLGLNDAVIARRNPVPISTDVPRLIGHLKGDGRYVLGRRPEFVIIDGPAGSPAGRHGMHSLGDTELLEQAGFLLTYRPCKAKVPLAPYAQTLLHRQSELLELYYFQRRDLQLPCVPDPL